MYHFGYTNNSFKYGVIIKYLDVEADAKSQPQLTYKVEKLGLTRSDFFMPQNSPQPADMPTKKNRP